MNTVYEHAKWLQSDFRKEIKSDYNRFIIEQSSRYSLKDCLKIDLHCHDYNSDVPDELLGRILKLPETWLKTEDLFKVLKSNHCSAFTITNHNNARSCWAMKEAGLDVLAAAEFTCYFPEDELFVHVLTYGFVPEQEVMLNKKRRNIYHFLAYCAEHNLPVTLAHPLFFYTRAQNIGMACFERFAVLFSRFEVMNGQRDYWQNVLTKEWVETLTPQRCEDFARKHHIEPMDFGVDVQQTKMMTGGSDDHMGIFAGECGSYLYVPDLQQRLKTTSQSELALEALRSGRIAPYGTIYENQKLNIALMDYFSQVATRMKEPGMLRILFHHGSTSDKVICFLFSNFIQELQRHGKTKMFFKFIHNALTGKKLNKLYTWRISKDYKFSIQHLEAISSARRKSSKQFIKATDHAIAELFTALNLLIIRRIQNYFKNNELDFSLSDISTEEIVRQFEVPSHFREMFSGKKTAIADGMVHFNLGKILDDLSFPVLVSIVIAVSMMTSTRLLCQNRTFLNQFSAYIDKYRHPRKTLWLTDTLFDKNGVSSSLQLILSKVQQQDLAIDFLVCHPEAKAQEHLHIVRPLTSFSINSLGEQVFNFPDFLEIKNIFYQGGYDRIICSTEAPMGPMALMLKHTFNVPCYFYMHTDWLEFINKTTQLGHSEMDRIRRLLRMYYQQFDGIFVLNTDHKKWLSSHEMQIDEQKIFMTAHWVHDAGVHDAGVDDAEKTDMKKNSVKYKVQYNSHKFYQSLAMDYMNPAPTLFFAGRMSTEKGIFDIPQIVRQVQQEIPEIKMIFAGTGPAEKELKKQLPDASFLGWVDQKQLAQLYSYLDLFIFPSRFDTFGNVVLEAFSYGMPVIAYNLKGPKDIIQNDINGYLVEDKEAMAVKIVHYFTGNVDKHAFKKNAQKRCQSPAYQADNILQQLQKDIGMYDNLS